MNERARWAEILAWRTWCELRVESERLYVGYLWWVIEPLLEMGVLYVVFHLILGSDIDHFLSFLLCGLVAWRWLSQSLTRAAPSILQSQPLASQVFVPKILFPLVMLAVDAVKFFVGLAVLLVFLIFDGFAPTASWAALPVVVAVQFLMIAALALWAAALVPFLRSILVAQDVALRFGLFVSGVFFDIGRLGEPLRGWLAWNPMATLLEAWRAVLLHGQWPAWDALAAIAVVSVLAAAGAAAFLHRHELAYPRLPA